jgi:outer membrane protein assembly factor BamB
MGSYAAASPALFENTAYVGHFGGEFIAVDLKTRESVWSFIPEDTSFPFYGSAGVNKDYVVVGSRDKNIYGLRRKTGEKIWEVRTRGEVDASPIITDKWAALGSKDGDFYVIELESGKILWQFTAGAPIAAGAAAVGDRIVFGDAANVLYCFAPKK